MCPHTTHICTTQQCSNCRANGGKLVPHLIRRKPPPVYAVVVRGLGRGVAVYSEREMKARVRRYV